MTKIDFQLNSPTTAASINSLSVRGTYSIQASLIKKVNKLALCTLAIYAIANLPTASGGVFSGLVTLAGCVGAGVMS